VSESGSGAITLSVVVPWVLTIVAAVIGAWQFILQQQQANRQPFLQKQLDLCFEASDTASRLATEPDPIEWEKDRRTFWRLYWGTLSIVEDPGVEGAMVNLGKLVPVTAVSNPKLPMASLQNPSYDLAHAFRRLILTSWNIDLPPLEDKRQQ
jgi:hypothetical protein